MSHLHLRQLNQHQEVKALYAKRVIEAPCTSRPVCFNLTVATADLALLKKLIFENSRNVRALMKVALSHDRQMAHIQLNLPRTHVDHLIHRIMTVMDSAVFGPITNFGGETQ